VIRGTEENHQDSAQRSILVWATFLLTLAVVVNPVGPKLGFLFVPLAAVVIGMFGILSSKTFDGRTSGRKNSIKLADLALLEVSLVGSSLMVFVMFTDEKWSTFDVRNFGVASIIAVLIGIYVYIQSRSRMGLFAACVFALGTLIFFGVAQSETRIDVLVFLNDGVHALLSGVNPWGLSFISPYPPELTSQYYGETVHAGQHLLFGFPYPSPPLLVATLGLPLGDVRLGAVVLHLLASLALYVTANDGRGALLSCLYLLSPGAFWTARTGWTELIGASLLALLVCALYRNSRVSAVLLGLIASSKQYFAFFVPLSLLLVPSARKLKGGLLQSIGLVFLTGLLAIVPFYLWDPPAFLNSVVVLQFNQPWRSDSFSLLVWWGENVTEVPALLISVLPLSVALCVSLLLGLKAPKTPWSFSASLGIAMCSMVLLSKQAFANYYSFAAAAVLIAAILYRKSDLLLEDSVSR